MNRNIICLVLLSVFTLYSCSKSEVEEVAETIDEDQSIVGKNPKKGFCITTKKDGWDAKIVALNASWHYSWNYEMKPEEPEGVEFVPMIWGAWADTAKVLEKLDHISELRHAEKISYMLGFNEPDKAEQANMSVETAVAYWPKLETLGIPLGSPACANPTGDWMKNFMEEAAKRNLRIDFVCVHWYGGINADNFLARLEEIHNLYDKPIWITEFAPADWSASSPSESRHTKSEILQFAKKVLPALDDVDYVQRYAWFSAKETSGPLGNAALFDSSGQLTALGKFYAQFEGEIN